MLTKRPSGGRCMVWPYRKDHTDYGLVWYKGRDERVHRLAYVLAVRKKPLPPGRYVIHTCDNRPCFRPDHLVLSDALGNNLDTNAKGRRNQIHGEQHPNSKLILTKVRKILELRKGNRNFWTYMRLGRKFKVSWSL